MKAPVILAAVWAALVPALCSCGEDGENREFSVALSDEEAIKLGNGFSGRVAQNVYLSRQMLVQAIYGATAQEGTGKVTETGTLTQSRFGFTYEPEPSDKLVLKLPTATHEFVVKVVRGNMQAPTPAAFLASNHHLHYVHTLDGVGAVEVKANAIGLGWAAEVTGWYEEEKQRYDLSLKMEGGSLFENGGRSGQESKTDYKIMGEVTAPDFKLTVDERHFFHLVSVGEAVTHSIDEIRNTLTVGSVTYKWVDASVTKVFKTAGGRMMPVFDASSKWAVKGKVLKDDKEFGSYKLSVGQKSIDQRRKYHGNLEIVVETAGDERIVLQSWRGS